VRGRQSKKVLVFGVFDGLHEGHRAFLKAAKGLGGYLVVVVAPDRVVVRLKGKKPTYGLASRMKRLRRVVYVDVVIKGDNNLGTYEVIKHFQPDVIALGYDQKTLRGDLLRKAKQFPWRPKVRMMKPHRPSEFHSRLFRGN